MFGRAPLAVRFVDRGRVQLLAPLVWRTSTTVLTVPASFETDGASVPAALWPVVGHPLSGSLLRAAILHDFEIVTQLAPSRVVHRRFYAALRSTGVGRVRAALLYAVVRLFGPRWG
jgi:hypothetical protein